MLQHATCNKTQDAVLSQGEPRDAAISFDSITQRHRAISLAQHGFLVYR